MSNVKKDAATKATKPVSWFAVKVARLRHSIGLAEKPSQKMLLTLNASGKSMYQGTANGNKVRARRAKNKVARRSRAVNRGR